MEGSPVMEGRAAGARDLRMGAMPLMMDLANLANQTVPVLDNALLARLVVGVCELVETTREPAQLENLVREIRRTDLSGLASMLIHDIASAEDFVVQTSSARHARVSGTGLVPRDSLTIHGMTVEDASKPPTSRNAEESGERVANKTPSFISAVLSASNGKTAGHLREVSEKNSRVSAVLMAAPGSAPRPALRKKNRLLSTKRTAYSVRSDWRRSTVASRCEYSDALSDTCALLGRWAI